MAATIGSVLLLLVGICAMTEVNCECEPLVGKGDGPVIPTLRDQFEATMIVTRPKKDQKIEVTEYYDFINNNGALYVYQDNKLTRHLNHFKTFESFAITDGNCTTTDMHTKTYWFDYELGDDGGHISSMADILKFGDQYKDVYYIGDEKVGNIPVHHWTTCVQDEKMPRNYTAHFYFSTPDYVSPAGKQVVPIRFETNDTADLEFYTIYDFMVYKPGPIRDPSVFEIPHGYVCTHEKKHAMPKLADAFTAHMELIHVDSKRIDHSSMAFNYDLKLSRYDITLSAKKSSEWPFGERPTTVINDYNTGIEYAIDIQNKNCTSRAIDKNARELKWDADSMVMDHGYELFRFADLEFYYQGRKQWRGVPCDVWSAQRLNWPANNQKTVMEAYFLAGASQTDWTSTSDSDEPGADPDAQNSHFMGLWFASTNDSNMVWSDTRIVHIFDYTPAPPQPSRFDIKDCYNMLQDRIHAMFRIVGKYPDIVTHKSQLLAPVVWQLIALKSGVGPIRISDIYFDASSMENTDVWFTILVGSDVQNPNISNPMEQISNDKAFAKLKDAINEGLSISVSYQDEDLTVIKDSLKTDQEVFDPRKVPPHISVHYGHSSGAMAGLGIGMCLVGGVIGAVLLVLWQRRQRNRRVPYSRAVDDM